MTPKEEIAAYPFFQIFDTYNTQVLVCKGQSTGIYRKLLWNIFYLFKAYPEDR